MAVRWTYTAAEEDEHSFYEHCPHGVSKPGKLKALFSERSHRLCLKSWRENNL